MFQLGGAAIITGAGSGIGKGVALAFARYGVKQLVLLDINAEGLENTRNQLEKDYPNVETIVQPADVCDEASIQDAINRAVADFKRVDYGVNCAGIGGTLLPTHEIPLKEWQKVIDINQTGVFLCQKHLILQMLKQDIRGPREGRGVIVNVSSMFGKVSPSTGHNAAPYVSSKHAVLGLTKMDAMEYGPKGIRINAICPGYVDTPLLGNALETGSLQKEFEKAPAGRPATVEEIADAIVFLASPMSSFMYGTGLSVDGGYSL